MELDREREGERDKGEWLHCRFQWKLTSSSYHKTKYQRNIEWQQETGKSKIGLEAGKGWW